MNRKLRNAAISGALLAAAAYAAIGWRESSNTPGGEPIVDVVVPELSGDALAGESLFNANCAQCHGKNAEGRNGSAPPLVHKIYEPNHHGDAAFFRAVQMGVRQHHWPFGNMPPVEGVNENETAKIVNYIRTLQRANGIR